MRVPERVRDGQLGKRRDRELD